MNILAQAMLSTKEKVDVLCNAYGVPITSELHHLDMSPENALDMFKELETLQFQTVSRLEQIEAITGGLEMVEPSKIHLFVETMEAHAIIKHLVDYMKS